MIIIVYLRMISISHKSDFCCVTIVDVMGFASGYDLLSM
jgi:hypothetical protein